MSSLRTVHSYSSLDRRTPNNPPENPSNSTSLSPKKYSISDTWTWAIMQNHVLLRTYNFRGQHQTHVSVLHHGYTEGDGASPHFNLCRRFWLKKPPRAHLLWRRGRAAAPWRRRRRREAPRPGRDSGASPVSCWSVSGGDVFLSLVLSSVFSHWITNMEFKNGVFNAARDGNLRRLKVRWCMWSCNDSSEENIDDYNMLCS